MPDIEDIDPYRKIYLIASKILLENAFTKSIHDYLVENLKRLYDNYKRKLSL